MCAAIVQLYNMYSIYYLAIRVISDLCAAYLYYYDDLKQTLQTLVALTQLVAATYYGRPLPLKSQGWLSCSAHLPSTVNPPALPCLHWVHPTNQDWQACPSKPFWNQHAKCCDPVQYFSSDYLPIIAIFQLTGQALWASTIYVIILPAPQSHFGNNTTSAVSQFRHSSSDYLPL